MNTKDDAIRRVLEKRMAVIEDHILTQKSNQTPLNLAYYEGKRDGYINRQSTSCMNPWKVY